jgi:uncharacterized membrane protein YphA (DoxX/SURF4 family)
MRRIFSTFAHGAPGIGLLLLRLATGSTLIYHGVTLHEGYAPFVPAAFRALSVLLGALLFMGLWTPIVGALVAVITVWEMVSHPASRPEVVWVAIIAAALVMLGPGGWSVDAWLYGWKQIKISGDRQSGQDSSI